jgi:dUTPase
MSHRQAPAYPGAPKDIIIKMGQDHKKTGTQIFDKVGNVCVYMGGNPRSNTTRHDSDTSSDSDSDDSSSESSDDQCHNLGNVEPKQAALVHAHTIHGNLNVDMNRMGSPKSNKRPLEEPVDVKFYLLPDNPLARLPTKKHDDDAAYDIYLTHLIPYPPEVIASEPAVASGQLFRFGTGLRYECPPGHYMTAHLKSKMATSGFDLANGTGILDGGYRGEIIIVLKKWCKESNYTLPWMAVQLIVYKGVKSRVIEVKEVNTTERGVTGGIVSDLVTPIVKTYSSGMTNIFMRN